MRTKNYYRIRLVVRVLFWGTLLTGVYAGGHYLDNHTEKYNCHQGDEGWTCDTRWK